MNFWKEFINACHSWLSADNEVKRGIEHAKTLVGEGKFDQALAHLRGLEESYPSESTRGLIAAYQDPLIDRLTAEMRELIESNNHAEAEALRHKAPDFFETMPEVTEFLASPVTGVHHRPS